MTRGKQNLPWLIQLGRAAVENPLYNRCIRERSALVTRQYDGRYYGYGHAAQQRFWEWWLDRFESVQQHCGTADFYLGLRWADLQGLLALLRYAKAAKKWSEEQP